MLTRSLAAGFRRSFACASVSLATVALATTAHAEPPQSAENAPQIVVRSDLLPDANPPAGVLDNVVDVTGVGQMRTITDLTTGTGFVCTGTLINPRTVIFAAHCVNDVPSSVYGNTTTGIPISFGFEANNLAARRIWAGLDPVTALPAADQSLKFKTNVARSLYNVEQVWYDPRSLDPAGFEFLQADVALATLDTHADGVPTWAMLFTPLTGPTHALVNGYGARGSNGTSGANLGVDSRRRIAENMIDFLGSLDDRDRLLFSEILGLPADPPFAVASVYQLDFDDPAGVTVSADNPAGFNFDVFPGQALSREGTTAGGDSGGPLIVDQKYTEKVVAGVLSGGSRFFGAQPFSSYGTTSFYQPLFLYWDQIVANNPYVYASAKAGNGNWSNPNHWVQDMDPNYKIDVNGQLKTGLPNTPAQGIATDTPKFGEVCYNELPPFEFSQCIAVEGSAPAAGNGPILIPGGPGSTKFVPNNTSGNRLTGARANYYEVTLNKLGTTTLSQTVTIDRLNLTGLAGLNINNAGKLTVLGDYTQSGGLLTINGLLKTGEALVAAGIVSGSGKIDPTFMTVMGAAVLPGGFSDIGTLTVQGDLILTSATLLNIDLNRNGADKLAVTGDAQNTGIADLGGTVLFTRTGGSAPRHGQSFKILTATGGVQGNFDNVFGLLGVLKPTLTYNANDVTATLKAGSLFDFLFGSGPVAQAFATALDQLRGSSYNSLSGLYGAIDLMEPLQLAHTLSGLNPRNAGEALAMTHDQTGVVRSLVSDRLSMLGTGETRTGSFSVIGAPETLGLAVGQTQLSGSSASQLSFARRYAPSQVSYGRLPDKVSGFISGGYDGGSRSFVGDESGGNRTSWHMAMGLEMEAASNLTLGTAFGLVDAQSMLTGSRAESRTSQAIGYGSYRLGGGAYVAGLASVSYSTIGLQRGVTTGIDRISLNGTTRALSYDLQAEAGVNLNVAKGLIVTPRASIRYAANEVSGFRENGGEVALLVDDLKDRRVEGRLGARLSGSTALGRSGWTFAPQLSADMVRTVAGGETSITVRFAEAAGLAFALPAFSQDRNWGEVRGGFQLSSGPLSLGAAVQSDIGRSDYRDNRAVADVTLRF